MVDIRFNPLLAAAVVTLAAASPAMAQKTHPAPPPHPAPATPPHVPAKTDRDDGARDAEHVRQDDAHMADRAREERALHAGGQETKTHVKESKAEKALDRDEHRALVEARNDSKTSTRGIRLTRAERAQIHAIDKKYDAQRKALEAEDRANEKAGRPDDAALIAKINAIRDQERAEIRGLLSASQQSQFDLNLKTPRH